MTDVEKLIDVFILAETEDELIKILEILEEKRPDLRWNGGKMPTDSWPIQHPVKIATDQPEFNRMQQVGAYSTYWEEKHSAKIQKIEDILGTQTSKTSKDICSCDGPSTITGFTTTYEVCVVCKKVKQ